MCIVLPMSHLSCSQTISIWQHCSDATPCGTSASRSCRDVCFHERPILTKKSCGDCNVPRLFTRRGGFAERGDSTSLRSLEPYANAKEEDANDSGYQSDVIHEEEEHSDLDECPVSPKAVAPPQARPQTSGSRKRDYRSLTRKPSWRPNLKYELSKIRLQDTSPPESRRNSIDSLLSQFDDRSWVSARVESGLEETATRSNFRNSPKSAMHGMEELKRRASASLHSSSPSAVDTVGEAQLAKAFPYAQVVDVGRPPSRQSSTRSRKRSTLLHPSSPELSPTSARPVSRSENAAPSQRHPAMHMRRESSLLHPSSPPRTATTLSPSQIPTIISIPPSHTREPAQRPSILIHSPRTQTSPQAPLVPPRRTPPLRSTLSEPQSTTMARQRRTSILHSSLSDQGDGSDDEGYGEEGDSASQDVRARLQAFSFNNPHPPGYMNRVHHNQRAEHRSAESALLTNSAQAAQASRHSARGERK
ncbi:hypothetical protein FB567DRAFT_547329 [Paraphoma chrysanthemicola]|uniref:Uncharacterized protein n=1 Tax=Paraphoma chrysanthemicola TaxID=798071 RepID=A0A8K0R952_9PLEO|nr:hypothetical protein FB567DRAFT_547329 [Paraphoma chrysanthemicola]